MKVLIICLIVAALFVAIAFFMILCKSASINDALTEQFELERLKKKEKE